MNNFIVIILTCLIALVNFNGSARASDQTDEYGIDGFSNMSEAQRIEAINMLVKDRVQLIEHLVACLDGAKPARVRIAAAFLLGAIHADSSARDLAQIIDLKDETVNVARNDKLPLWGQYPVVDALVRLGVSARPALLHNLATSEDPNVQNLSARALQAIYTPEIAKAVVQQAISAESTSKLVGKDQRIAHLKKSLALFQS